MLKFSFKEEQPIIPFFHAYVCSNLCLPSPEKVGTFVSVYADLFLQRAHPFFMIPFHLIFYPILFRKDPFFAKKEGIFFMKECFF